MHLDGHFVISVFLNSVRSVAVLIHFHILFFVPRYDGDDYNDCLNLESVLFREVLAEWKRNVASPVWSDKKQKFIPNTRCPVYKPLCTYVRKFIRGKIRTNYDLHYVNPVLSDGGTADVAFYVLKYMLKPSDRATKLRQALHLNLPQEEYNDVWKVVKPRHFESDGFGLGQNLKSDSGYRLATPNVYQHLRSSIARSKGYSAFPSYFSPVTGQSFPLARYYKNRGDIYSVSDALDFHFSSVPDGRDKDMVVIKDVVHGSQLIKKVDDFQKRVSRVDFQQSSAELDDLFDETL